MKTITEIREELFNLLEVFHLPIYLQGSMNESEVYPELFITYFIPEVDDVEHFDNEPFLTSYTIEVAVYGNDIDRVDELTSQIKALLKSGDFNFVISGDVQSDVQTHLGIMQRFIKLA